jgi:hypothetical protein
MTRQGDTHTTTYNNYVDTILTDAFTINVSLEDPSTNALVTSAAPTKDGTGRYHYDYTFPSDADTGNYTFIWMVEGVEHDEIVNLKASFTSDYCNETLVETLTNGIEPAIADDLLEAMMIRADNWINSKITETNLPVTIPDSIIDAASYRAAMLILDAMYATRDQRSPTAVQYEKEANDALEAYLLANPNDAEVNLAGLSMNSAVSYDKDYPNG